MANPRATGVNLIAVLVVLIGGGALLYWFVIHPLFN